MFEMPGQGGLNWLSCPDTFRACVPFMGAYENFEAPYYELDGSSLQLCDSKWAEPLLPRFFVRFFGQVPWVFARKTSIPSVF